MNDLISRQAALDALDRLEYTPGEWATNGLTMCKDAIKAQPSATDTNVGGNLIDRQAALDAIKKLEKPAPTAQHLSAIFDCEDTIKALPSAQPVVISKSENTTECEDAVSREAVLNEIHRYMEERDYTIGLLDDNVCGLPPVTPKQPGWIPIGAPMNSGQHYLVTLRQKFEGEETYRVRIMRLHEGHWLYPHHFPEWINDEIEQEVVAWMPLPTPYREGGQE